MEFAGALLTWFLLLADGGLELWGTREAAGSSPIRSVAARVVPLRAGLALLSFAVLCGLAAAPGLLPTENGDALRIVLVLFGVSLFPNALNLKWAFLGRELMSRVATGLVLGQILFAAGVFALVRSSDPLAIYLAPLLRLASEVAMAVYFYRRFRRDFGPVERLAWTGAGAAMKPALTLGAVQALGLLNFNFDALLLGFLRGVRDVGLYNVAYKPVTIALAVPLTYFQGLFPALSRKWTEGPEALRELAERSLRLCAIFSVPLGVGGTMLAVPVIALLFGPQYAESAAPLQVLVWSAVLAILRGSYRHSLNAAGLQGLDLQCAVVSSSLNVGLNLALIPRFGMLGAAGATVFADLVWFAMACWHFNRRIVRLGPLPALARPLLAGAAMWAVLRVGEPLFWVWRAAASVAVYFSVLLILREPEVRAWAAHIFRRANHR